MATQHQVYRTLSGPLRWAEFHSQQGNCALQLFGNVTINVQTFASAPLLLSCSVCICFPSFGLTCCIWWRWQPGRRWRPLRLQPTPRSGAAVPSAQTWSRLHGIKAKRQTLWMPLRLCYCLYFEVMAKKKEAGSDGQTDKVKTDPLWTAPAESPRASVCVTDRPSLTNQETESKWWWVCRTS